MLNFSATIYPPKQNIGGMVPTQIYFSKSDCYCLQSTNIVHGTSVDLYFRKFWAQKYDIYNKIFIVNCIYSNLEMGHTPERHEKIIVKYCTVGLQVL
jgi:hypothetical protein